jgi:hypothetical protein
MTEGEVEVVGGVEGSNVELIYEYTEWLIGQVGGSVNGLNTRLAGLLGFSGVMLRLALDVPRLNWLWLVCGAFLVAMMVCVWGLWPVRVQGLTTIDHLLENYFYETDERCRLHIVRSWKQVLEGYEKLRERKALALFCGLIALVVGFLLMALDALI